MHLIIGLGNPGKQYEKTRHNIGFILCDFLVHLWELQTFTYDKKFFAEISSNTIFNKKIILIKPQTFMNRSGISTQLLVDYFKIQQENILILHDDKDLSFGEIRIATDSSSAGHRGVQNIFDTLKTQKIQRVRIGVGPIPEYTSTEKYVLDTFTQEEKEKLLPLEEVVSRLVQNFLQ